jgi:hypothetical protein
MTASPTRQASARAAGVICVECLHCRHRGVLSDRILTRYGLSANAPIASFVRRLTCERCGHHRQGISRTGWYSPILCRRGRGCATLIVDPRAR